MLSSANSGCDDGIAQWCLYVLAGIRGEHAKVDQLTNYDNSQGEILFPALDYSKTRGLINGVEEKVLRRAAELGTFKAIDFGELFPGVIERQRTYQLKKLVDAQMLSRSIQTPGSIQSTLLIMH